MSKKILLIFGQSYLVFGLVFIVYALTAFLYRTYEVNHFNYFSHLAYAFLHGSTALITTPNEIADLIPFNGRTFIFAPPSPVLLVIPFILLFGIGVSSSFYTLFIGALNPVLLYWIIARFSKLFAIKISKFMILLLVIFYALGTSHFYESVLGRVWDTGQIFSQTYILLALLFFLIYESKLNYKYLYPFFVFLFLALMGRNHFILSIPGLLLLHYAKHKNNKILSLTYAVAGTVVVFILVYFWYNFVRFGNILESGLKYHNVNDFFKPDIAKYGLFSPHFIPINLYYSLINPFRLEHFSFPFILSSDPKGNSLFLASPLLFYLFSYLLYKKNYHLKLVLMGFAAAIIGIYLPSVAHFSTGWVQFGARYFLDPMPFIILLLVPVLARARVRYVVILVLLSIYIQFHAFMLF